MISRQMFFEILDSTTAVQITSFQKEHTFDVLYVVENGYVTLQEAADAIMTKIMDPKPKTAILALKVFSFCVLYGNNTVALAFCYSSNLARLHEILNSTRSSAVKHNILLHLELWLHTFNKESICYEVIDGIVNNLLRSGCRFPAGNKKRSKPLLRNCHRCSKMDRMTAASGRRQRHRLCKMCFEYIHWLNFKASGPPTLEALERKRMQSDPNYLYVLTNSVCLVCFEHESCYLALPCTHLAFCGQCAKSYSQMGCPFCESLLNNIGKAIKRTAAYAVDEGYLVPQCGNPMTKVARVK